MNRSKDSISIIDLAKQLMKTFSDYRKLIVSLILAPYLVVIKKLSYEESYKIIYEWLQKCDSLSGRKLDFDPKYLINNSLKTSSKKLIPPILLVCSKIIH